MRFPLRGIDRSFYRRMIPQLVFWWLSHFAYRPDCGRRDAPKIVHSWRSADSEFLISVRVGQTRVIKSGRVVHHARRRRECSTADLPTKGVIPDFLYMVKLSMKFSQLREHFPSLSCTCGHTATLHLPCGEYNSCMAYRCLCLHFHAMLDRRPPTDVDSEQNPRFQMNPTIWP